MSCSCIMMLCCRVAREVWIGLVLVLGWMLRLVCLMEVLESKIFVDMSLVVVVAVCFVGMF